MLASHSAGLVSNHSGNLRLLLDESEPIVQQNVVKPLETRLIRGARIHIADASGQPIPNLKTGTTGPAGEFVIPDVPPGSTLMIVAQVPVATGATAEFRSLVKLTPLGASTVLSPASTLVTTNLVDTLPGTELGEFKPSIFQNAIEAVDKRLTEANVPDFSDAKSVRALITRLSEEIDELKSLITEMRQDLKNVQQSLDAIQASLEESKKNPAPQSPIAVANTTTNAAPGVRPSASPTAVTSETPFPSPPPSIAPSKPPEMSPRPSAQPTLAFGTGTISASTTSPVIKPGERATVYISWTTRGCPEASVYLSVDESEQMQLFGKASSYSRAAAPWISLGPTFEFKLYKDPTRTELLATVRVVGVEEVPTPSPEPSATVAPVTPVYRMTTVVGRH